MCGHSFHPGHAKTACPGARVWRNGRVGFSFRSTPLAEKHSGRNTVGLNKEFSLHEAIAGAGRCRFGLARSARK